MCASQHAQASNGYQDSAEGHESYRTAPICGAHLLIWMQSKNSRLTLLEPATWIGGVFRPPSPPTPYRQLYGFTGQFVRPNREAHRGCRRATAPGQAKVHSVSSRASKMLPFFDQLWLSSRTRCAISAASGRRRRSRGSARLFHPRLGSPHSSYRLRSSFRHACNLLPGSRRRHAAVVSLSLHCANSCGARAAL